MQIKNKNISWFWLSVIILQYYVDGTILFAVVLLNVFYYCKLKLPWSKGIGIMPLIILLGLGIIIGGINLLNYNLRDFIRDIYYFLQPVMYIYAGYIFFRNTKDDNTFYRTICIAAAVLAVIYGINLLKNPSLLRSDTVIGIRTGVGKEQFVLLTATVFLTTKQQIFKHKIQIGLLCLIGGVFALQFSRTAYGTIAIVLLVYLLQNRSITSGMIKKGLAGVLIIIIFWNLLPRNLTDDFMMRIMRSLTEVSADATFNTLQDVQANWRGYENYIVINEVLKGDLFNTILGYGFGKTASLNGFVVNLGGNDFSNISTFHNGYMIVLLKNGIFGLICYILFFFNLVRKNFKINNYESKLVVAFVSGMLFMTYTKGGILRGSSVLEFCLFIGFAYGKRIQWVKRKYIEEEGMSIEK